MLYGPSADKRRAVDRLTDSKCIIVIISDITVTLDVYITHISEHCASTLDFDWAESATATPPTPLRRGGCVATIPLGRGLFSVLCELAMEMDVV